MFSGNIELQLSGSVTLKQSGSDQKKFTWSMRYSLYIYERPSAFAFVQHTRLLHLVNLHFLSACSLLGIVLNAEDSE